MDVGVRNAAARGSGPAMPRGSPRKTVASSAAYTATTHTKVTSWCRSCLRARPCGVGDVAARLGSVLAAATPLSLTPAAASSHQSDLVQVPWRLHVEHDDAHEGRKEQGGRHVGPAITGGASPCTPATGGTLPDRSAAWTALTGRMRCEPGCQAPERRTT